MPRTRSVLDLVREIADRENRLNQGVMPQSHADKQTSSAAGPVSPMTTGAAALTVFLVFMVCAAGTLAILSAQSAEPFVLTLMALLATLGVFFVFGVAAGHVRISERTQAADLLEAVADRQDNAQFLTTLDGRLLHANQPAHALLGTNQLGQYNNLEQTFAISQVGAEALFRLTRANQRQQSHIEILEKPAGDGISGLRSLRISVKPFGIVDLPEFAGRAALWTVADVTDERHRTQETIAALQHEVAQYATLPAGVMMVTDSGDLGFVNAYLLRQLGHDQHRAAAPQRLTDILRRHDADLLLRLLGEAEVVQERTLDLDFVNVLGERWPATCIVHRTAAREESDPVLNLIVHPRATLAREAPHLSQAEAQFSDLFRTAPFGIALVAGDSSLSASNPAFLRLIGGGKAPKPGAPALSAFYFNEDHTAYAEVAQALDAARRGKAEIFPIEADIGEQGEFARRIVVQSLSEPDTDGNPAVVFVTDATEERSLGLKFAQSQKMEAVGKLAGGIAHDFNNVLTAIIGFSDLLLASHRPSDHAYKNIQNIRSSANHAASLVKQLLAFSRRQTLEPEVIQLNELVTDLSVILNRLLGENIELKISSGRDLWAVKADLNQINQVVINLAVNARDAMADGGRLTIRTRNISERESLRLADLSVAVGEYVMIEVDDTGAGMSKEVMAKVFEPFFTTKDVGKGTGLGLSTVYGIIKQTGGYVFADSTEGVGTTFRVYLPRCVPNEAEQQQAPRPPKGGRPADLTGHGRVLVVEDEDAVRIFATEALRRQGYEVLQACDGLEALDVLEDCDHKVDLVVSDVKMPEMDGPTLYKELRKINPDIKFIFVSGYTDDAFTKTLDPGSEYTFLPKPYTLAQIAEVVKGQLG
jgi:two-component system cell cycle sensor histidine kinase/response regulator CckA